MTSAEKLRLARQLDTLGVDIIEAGFAIASEDDASATSAIAKEIRRPTIASLARANKRDIESAAMALEPAIKPRIHIVLASSDLHLEYKRKMTRNQALNLAGECIRHARKFVDEVQYSLEDATRADREYVSQVVDAAIDAAQLLLICPIPSGMPFLPSTQYSLLTCRKESGIFIL